jgi:hypothetical protein
LLYRRLPLLTLAKELGSPGNCNISFETVWENAHKSSRYANTLLVSLNNRIYFRDYAARHGTVEVHMGSNHLEEGSQSHNSHRSALTSIRINQVGSPTNTTTVGNTFKLDTISHVVPVGFQVEKSKGEGHAIDITPDGRC